VTVVIFFTKYYSKELKKAGMEMRKFEKVSFFWILAALFLFPVGTAIGQDVAEPSRKAEEPAPKSDLDKLKTEWEAVREQQIQMLLEKERQLEKLKEEIFAKMKALNVPATPQSGKSQPVSASDPSLVPQGETVPDSSSELEVQKSSFQAERQKFFAEMSRQKESLRQLQSSLDQKAKQLAAERERFEQEKKTAGR